MVRSRGLAHQSTSTNAGVLNCRVRNETGCFQSAMAVQALSRSLRIRDGEDGPERRIRAPGAGTFAIA